MPQLVDNHPRALLLLLFSAVYYFITGETFVLTEFIGAVTAESAMNTNCPFWHFFFTTEHFYFDLDILLLCTGSSHSPLCDFQRAGDNFLGLLKFGFFLLYSLMKIL